MRANLVALSGDGTRLCHGAITSANKTYDIRTGEYCYPDDVLRGIRRNMSASNIDYVTRVKSVEWLERRYPRTEEIL